jgi:Rrf2 family protein
MKITARADYAIRSLLELAAAPDAPIHADAIARSQAIPGKFLEAVLGDLRRAKLVTSRRGAAGGYRLARPADSISLADVIRAVEGPLAGVRDLAPEALAYTGPAESLRDVWVALRAGIRAVLESVTLADVASGHLPPSVSSLLATPDAWSRR